MVHTSKYNDIGGFCLTSYPGTPRYYFVLVTCKFAQRYESNLTGF